MKETATLYRAQQKLHPDVTDLIGYAYNPMLGEISGIAVVRKTVHRLASNAETLPFDIWEGDEFIFPNDPDMAGHEFRVIWDNFGWWFYSRTYPLREIHLGALSTEQWQGAEKTGNYFQREMYVK